MIYQANGTWSRRYRWATKRRVATLQPTSVARSGGATTAPRGGEAGHPHPSATGTLVGATAHLSSMKPSREEKHS